MNNAALSCKLRVMSDCFAGSPEVSFRDLDMMIAGQLAARLTLLAAEAERLETEVDRLTWALGKARDAERNAASPIMDAALATIERMIADDPPPRAKATDFAAIERGLSDGSVTLFPIIRKPAFCDGGAS